MTEWQLGSKILSESINDIHLAQPKIRDDSNSPRALLGLDSAAMWEAIFQVLFNYFADNKVILSGFRNDCALWWMETICLDRFFPFPTQGGSKNVWGGREGGWEIGAKGYSTSIVWEWCMVLIAFCAIALVANVTNAQPVGGEQ